MKKVVLKQIMSSLFKDHLATIKTMLVLAIGMSMVDIATTVLSEENMVVAVLFEDVCI